MNYAALWVRDFALHALRRSDPALAGRPVALVAGEGRRARVLEASPEAAPVAPGDAADLALARRPGLLFRPRDPAAEVEAQRLLLAAAFTLAPRVEATAPGLCTADLQGADPARAAADLRLRVHELARAGLPARAGAAANPFLAACAARTAEPVRLVDDARAFLAPLPLEAAEPAPEQAAILRGWGIRTLGDLTDIPKAEIGQRLGTEGALLWERAAGESERVLRLVEPARTFAAEWTYEPPVETLEPLLFKLRRFAERLAFELRGAGFAAEKLALTLRLEDGAEHRREFRLPEPAADVDAWLRILQAHLDSVRTPARVAAVVLSAAPARSPAKQDGLFDTGLRDPAAFWENLARLGAIVGDDRVGTPEPLDTHQPDRFELRRPAEAVPPPAPPPPHAPRGLALRRFRPGLEVGVALDGGRPARLDGTRLRGAVRRAEGPWRLSGGWWRPDAWSVETWDVELEEGGLYRLARTAAGWRVEGMYD